ncbi:multidrug resistance efflux pump [Brevundimonas bullata]|uniref:Multidrug resistance efflux pump n=1 Tax=Brevundimonas bullata TaxID=13160 RepID=A0A7W7ILM9_9CAUL|nr:HlyD family secretion protein [Brevundimonas bullata]MBB4796615.1 multidrug resistance efflux pump [Brevundimonas bullata]MBB6381575.1 multidrug resistance efflux pump [Brevundimonas bullata]
MTDATPAPAPAPAAPPPPAPAPAAPPPSNDRRVMWSVVMVLIALVGVGLILHAWRLPPFDGGPQTTDNAYVRGQVTVISPQVSGYVTSVEVQDFQMVKQGQLLATIDDRIYRQKLEQAKASLHSAEAALANSAQSQASARGSVAQTRASIAAAESAVTKARADAQRVRTLFAGGWVAQAQVDTAQNALRAAEAQLAAARAAEGVAQTGVTSAVVGRGSLEAAVENAQAQVRLAQIDLENTRITAPRAGRLGEVSVRVGQQVSVGTQLMALVPDAVWVTANMKETQMRDIRVGQPVEISVDVLGGQTLKGRVERISPATGSEFSVIRPDNATGNFTKVAQRVPVRISIDPGQEAAARLAPGMSVTARIDVSASGEKTR